MKYCRQTFFTLAETLVAVGLMALLTATSIPFMYNTLQVSFANRMKNDLTLEQYLCSESLKRDILSTSRAKIVVTPTDGTAVQAVSFPIIWMGKDIITYPLDSEEEINWTDTILYHLFNNPDSGTRELRRTRFQPRDNSLNLAQREQQLDYVLHNGDASGTYNGANAGTNVLLTDVRSHRITVNPHEVDSYAPQETRTVVTLGSALLDPGVHQYKFEVIGRHPLSSGYGIALDTVTASQSGYPLEAEYLLDSATVDGPKLVQRDMSAQAGWSNHAVLDFPATSTGQNFVLQIHNDCWLESNFTSDTASLSHAEIALEKDLGESVLQQIGYDITWEARVQSNGAAATAALTAQPGATVRVLIAGGDPIAGGCIFYAGQRGSVTFSNVTSNGPLTVERAYIMERANDYNGIAETVQELEFEESSNSTDVAVNAEGTGFTLMPGAAITSDRFKLPLDPAKDYLVSFQLTDVPEQANLTEWIDTQALTHSYIVKADTTDLAGTANWGTVGSKVTPLSSILAVASLFATYPETSLYTSRIFDTRLPAPEYLDVDWRLKLQGGTTAPLLKLRTGNQPDLSDAVQWQNALTLSNVNNSSLAGLPPGRYVQFQVIFQGIAPYENTAKVRDLLIRWKGESKGVEFAAAIMKGPDKGKFRFYLDDGSTATSDLSFQFVIQKRFRDRRYETSFAVDGKPRNK